MMTGPPHRSRVRQRRPRPHGIRAGVDGRSRPARARASESGSPESESGSPESESDCPESESGSPESESGSPESESDCPESESGSPESESDCPESESDCPESESDCPESESGSPESESGSPRWWQRGRHLRRQGHRRRQREAWSERTEPRTGRSSSCAWAQRGPAHLEITCVEALPLVGADEGTDGEGGSQGRRVGPRGESAGCGRAGHDRLTAFTRAGRRAPGREARPAPPSRSPGRARHVPRRRRRPRPSPPA